MIPKNLKHLLSLFLLVTLIACNSDDNNETDQTGGDITNPNNGSCESGKNAVFIEKDGLLIIESENANFSDTPWSLAKSLPEFSGSGYLVWDGEDFLGKPGEGLLSYKIRISTPGTYRFIWRSHITIGTNGTEHNDSWLRIADAKHFYGKRGDGNIIYPNDTQQEPIPESEGQQNTAPNGSSSQGWFKIFMNKANKWHWQSSTSDNDSHNIFVVFDTPGDYTVEISGRSRGHGIDKFALFTDDVEQNEAIKDNATQSDTLCE